MTMTRKWSLLASVLIVAVLAAGWFLLVTPKRSEAADLHQQAISEQKANAELVQKLEILKTQQADLPKQRARLATVRTQIPQNPALPNLIRALSAAARTVGVSLDALTPSAPVPLVATPEALQPAPATDTGTTDTGTSSTGTTDTGTSSTGTTDTGTATVPAAVPTLYQLPLAVEVSGSYFEIEQFVNKLEGLKRSFLVTGFKLDVAPPSTAGDTSAGLKLTVQGEVFMLPALAAPTQPTPVAAASAGK